MKILAIDTSNEVLGVAVTEQHQIVAEVITSSKQDHSTRLMPAIVDIMKKAKIAVNELDQIIVAHGPGSYTGSRVGVTTAKTMAWGLDIPIYTVSSLELLALNGNATSHYICPFFNARRQSVFTGLYKWENSQLVEVEAERNIAMREWLAIIKAYERPILFLSPHLSIFEQMIGEILGEDVRIPEGGAMHTPRPSNMYLLSTWSNEALVHHVAPNYLRKTEAETILLNKKKDEQNNG